MRPTLRQSWLLVSIGLSVVLSSCATGESIDGTDTTATGGATGFGSGGASNGGASNGGVSNAGGTSNGGTSNGGASNGGASSGGASNAGGANSGGASNAGGANSGGASNAGGANSGGASNAGGANNAGGATTGCPDADGDGLDDCTETDDGDPWTDPAIFNGLTAELDTNGGGNCNELSTYETMSAQFRTPAEHHDVHAGWDFSTNDDAASAPGFGFAPAFSSNDTGWRMRYRGLINLPQDGEYCFEVDAASTGGGTPDECVQVYVNQTPGPAGKWLAQNGYNGPASQDVGCVTLTAGVYPIDLVFQSANTGHLHTFHPSFCFGGASACTPSTPLTQKNFRPPLCADSNECQCEYYGGHAYRMCRTNRTFSDATTQCGLAGMQMVHLDSSAEDTAIYDTMDARGSNTAWIGASDALTEGAWMWLDGTQFWSGTTTGNAVGGLFTNWAVGEPNNAGGAENCARYFAAPTWGDVSCTSSLYYACESCGPLSAPGRCPPPEPEAGCTLGTHAGRSYWLCDTPHTWTDARAKCMAVGASLVTIDDAAEGTYVGGAVAAPSFIGLNDRDDYGGEGTYVWQNHEAAAYRSWAAGEPSTASAVLDCAETAADGTWSEVDCGATLPYVCEESGTTNVTQVTENATATLTCASGTIHAYTSLYGVGCAGACPLSCGTCTLGATSCSVTYNNANCTDCSSGCSKQGGLALSCE